MKSILLLIVGVAIGLISPRVTLFDAEKEVVAVDNEGYSAYTVIYKAGLPVGLEVPVDITGMYRGTSTVLLSPDEQRIAYSVWEDAHIVIYVGDPDGNNVRKVAEQEVAEGSGELDVASIQWSEDGEMISYLEKGPKTYKYTVDVATGEKTMVVQ